MTQAFSRTGSPAPDVTLSDHDGQSVPLSSLWRDRPLVLIFIRHTGCPFCREHVAELRDRAAEFEAAGASVVIVTMSSVAQAQLFRSELKLPFRVLSDVEQAAYRAFEVPRGGLFSVAGPSVWARGFFAMWKHGGGRMIGDPFQLPGSFVIDRAGVIRLADYSRNSAEWASSEQLLTALNPASGTSANPSNIEPQRSRATVSPGSCSTVCDMPAAHSDSGGSNSSEPLIRR